MKEQMNFNTYFDVFEFLQIVIKYYFYFPFFLFSFFYSFFSLFLGIAAVCKAHTPDFSQIQFKPSFFYKNHLEKLKKNGIIDEEKYNKYLNIQ